MMRKPRKKRGISTDQRRALFAAGRARGFDLAALRGLTPAGSVSAMSPREAETLIARLRGIAAPPPRRRGTRPPTAAQLGLIHELIRSTRVSPNWLQRFGAESVATIPTRTVAMKIITALRAIQNRLL